MPYKLANISLNYRWGRKDWEASRAWLCWSRAILEGKYSIINALMCCVDYLGQ